MNVFVHSDDAQYELWHPFGTVSSTAGEVYDARRDADITGGQSWSETDAILAELDGFKEKLKQDFDIDLDVDRTTIWNHSKGAIQKFRERDPRFLAPADKQSLDQFDSMIEILNRAASENPNHYKTFEQIEESVAKKAREKWELAERTAARAHTFDRLLGEGGAALVRDVNEPMIVLGAAATAPLAAEYFGASIFARGLGIAASEAAVAGITEGSISSGLTDYWRRQGFTEEQIQERMLTNVAGATIGAAVLSPVFYLGGLAAGKGISKVLASKWANDITSRDIPKILEAADEMESSGIKFTEAEKADIAFMKQRKREIDEMPPFLDKNNFDDVSAYQTKVQKVYEALVSGSTSKALGEEIASTDIPKLQSAIDFVGAGNKAPTRNQIKKLLNSDEFDNYNTRLRQAKEDQKAVQEAAKNVIPKFKKKSAGEYRTQVNDESIEISKAGRNKWEVKINDEVVETTPTLKEAQDSITKRAQEESGPVKTSVQIAREVALEVMGEALARRKAGPAIRRNLEPASPIEVVEKQTSPSKIANPRIDDSPVGIYTGSNNPDKTRSLLKSIEDEQLSQRIANGDFDDQLYKDAMDTLEQMRGRTEEEADLFAKLEKDLVAAETKLSEAEAAAKASPVPDAADIESRIRELDSKDKLTPEEEVELGDLQGQLFDIENAPEVLKPDLDKLKANVDSIKAAMKDLDDKLVARQADSPFATQEELEFHINELRESQEDELELDNLLQCVIRNNASG